VHQQFQPTTVPHLHFVDSENATAWKQRIFFLIGIERKFCMRTMT